MKIYVDFDRTLFDCDCFLDDLYAVVDKYEISVPFREYQNQCKKKGFNPYTILDLVKKEYDFDDAVYQEIDDLMNNGKKYLYSDAYSFLDYLRKKGYEIIILTRGNSNYQRKKISLVIDGYFDKLIVTMNHKGKLKLDYSNSIFIDDNPKEIQSIILNNPKKIIRMQRENSKYNNIDIENDISVVKTLKEIIDNKLLDI